MKRLFLAAAAGLAATVLAGPAEDIAKVHMAFTKAAEANDVALVVKLIDAHMAGDFKYTNKGGQSVNKAQWSAILKQQMSSAKTKTFRFKEGATGRGPNGTIKHTSTLTWEGSMKMPDGKFHKMASVSVGNEVWAMVKGRLQVKSITEVKSSMTMDGKPFNPAAPPPSA